MSFETASEIKNDELNKAIHNEKGKLFNFISRKMPSTEDAKDVLQDVFFELVESGKEMKTIEHVASWL